MNLACVHAADLPDPGPPADGCEVCLDGGGEWKNLRQCLTCGHTLCCDSSPAQHMSRHWEQTGHPLMRSATPGQEWTWCYPDESMVREADGTWETYDLFLDMGRPFAARHLEAGGSLDVDPEAVTEEGFPLGAWFAHVREQKLMGELDPRDEAEIEGLPGWAW